MPLVTRHPLLLQTAFSELKRQAMEQPFFLVGTPGSVSIRIVNGRKFYYCQFYDAQGKKSAEYLGALDAATACARAEEVAEQIAVTNTLIRDARLLAQRGYLRADTRTYAVLASIANHGLFRAGAVLVGSHAYAALQNELGAHGGALLTEDVDIARGGSPLAIAPGRAEDFAEVLAESTVPLHPVPGLDPRSPATSYKVAGRDRFRVDLLTPTGGHEVTTRAIPELNARATALPYLGYLLDEPIDAVVLAREGVVPVRVPRPEALAWHKMLASQLRRSTSEKKGKDALQAAVLFAVLAEQAPDALESAFAALPRGGKSKTRSAAKQVILVLERHAEDRAVELMRTLVA